MTPSTGAWKRAFHIVNGFHAGVQIFNEEGQANTDHQSDDNAQDDVQRLVGQTGFLPGWAWSMRVTMDVVGMARSSCSEAIFA